MTARALARGAALSIAGICVVASACKGPMDPTGHHAGHCVVYFRAVGSDGETPSASEVCAASFDVHKDGEGFKLELGDCTVHLAPLARSDDTEWKLASVAPCRTKAGMSRMAEGKLYAIAGTFNFTFDGSTDDKKTAVSWAFTGEPPAK